MHARVEPVLMIFILQIQVREKWSSYYGYKWFNPTARGTYQRRRGGSLRSLRASKVVASYIRFWYFHSLAQGKSRYRNFSDAVCLQERRATVWIIRHVRNRCYLHLLRSHSREMRSQSVQANSDTESRIRWCRRDCFSRWSWTRSKICQASKVSFMK